jgi:hypothetical protein
MGGRSWPVGSMVPVLRSVLVRMIGVVVFELAWWALDFLGARGGLFITALSVNNGKGRPDGGNTFVFGYRRLGCGYETPMTTTQDLHLSMVQPVVPNTPEGCEECLAIGSPWEHLRLCLTCGHVGCCDSSPNRHARLHAHAMGHPIVRSFEPGEDWRWCFVDEVLV